jgi:hypothetical protein
LVGINSQFNIAAQVLTKTFERVSTDKDRDFYLEQMPSVLDNPDAALAKLQAIKKLFVTKHKIFREALLKKGVPETILGPELTGELQLDVQKNTSPRNQQTFNPDSYLGE